MVLDDSTNIKNSLDKPNDVCLAPKTIAIVMRQRKDSKLSNKKVSGERLFSMFKRANAGCTWNVALSTAIRKMVFVGSLRPHTLLIYGTSDHIEALRSAWIKNLLTAPDGFSILYFGELPSLYIEPINHTNFTPLPDALCSIILNMNRSNIPATLTSLRRQLETVYKHVQPPTDQVVFEALNSLIKDKKICLTDVGYFISCEATRPLSIFVSGNYAPVFVMSPQKTSPDSEDNQLRHRTSPSKAKNGHKRTKSLNNQKSKPSQNHLEMENLEVVKNHNVWNEQQTNAAAKTKVKDKGAALRKLFGMKSKSKKVRSKSGGSTGTYSGSSSNHSPRNSQDDEEQIQEDAGLLMNVVPYIMDSRTTSQLTSAAVPFKLSPPEYGNYLNDSLQVHCGKTIMTSPQSRTDSEYETENEKEMEDRVPEIRPVRNQRFRASNGMRRQIANPAIAWRQYRRGSTSSDDGPCQIPTAQMYFNRKKYRTMSISSARNSTRVEGSTHLEPNPPNVSSINIPTHNDTALINNNSPISLSSTRVAHMNTTEICGSDQERKHHSTPIEDSSDDRTQRFQITNYEEGQTTPKLPSAGSRGRRLDQGHSVCCVCDSHIKCACSCHESDVCNNAPRVKLVYTRLASEVAAR